MLKQSKRGGLRNPPGGRPPKSKSEMFKRVFITLPPDLLTWLDVQPGKSRSHKVQELIRERMKLDE